MNTQEITHFLEQVNKDMGFCKALVWLGKNEFRWCKCQLVSGPNQHGQYSVKRIRNNFLGVTTEIRNISEKDKIDIVNQLGYNVI